MEEVKELTIKVTVDMDDDVKALVDGWRDRAITAEAENKQLRKELSMRRMPPEWVG